MFFQTLDDKSECVGVYIDGNLYFDDIPDTLTKTWKYSGSLQGQDIEYIGLFTSGASLNDSCPLELQPELEACQKKFRAYIKSFSIAKINMRDHCVFDLVPHDFLMRFCEIKNKITEHVYETYPKPGNYEHLSSVHKLLHKIKFQRLNLSAADCRHVLTNTRERQKLTELINHYRFIDYNLFGTVTGRLTTKQDSFPILTLKKELRQIIKPNNDLFVCLDYNGAEVRTLLELSEQPQPQGDIHAWNAKNLFEQEVARDEGKVRFFAWLYEPTYTDVKEKYYNREKILDKWYKEGFIYTPYKRKIEVEERKALNYLLQSTTSDRVLSKATKIDEFLMENNCKSYISHIVHDEIVLDYCDDDRKHIKEIKEIFEDGYMANINAGKDYYNLKELKI